MEVATLPNQADNTNIGLLTEPILRARSSFAPARSTYLRKSPPGSVARFNVSWQFNRVFEVRADVGSSR